MQIVNAKVAELKDEAKRALEEYMRESSPK